jgi:hypothetical protein
MLNRSAYIVRYKQPFVDWINAADPHPGDELTIDDVNEDSTVYLVDVEEEEDFREWIRLNHDIIFDELLNDWYTDPSLWPDDRTFATLIEWCSFEFHSLVLDTGGPRIEDDEAEES